MIAPQTAPAGPAGLHNPLDALLGYQLRRASTVMMAHLGAALAETGLTPTEASILLLIDANPACTQSDLGRALAIKRANMVPLMSGLLKRGAVERAPVDGRSQALSITANGQALVADVRSRIDRHEQCFQGQFDAKALDAMIAGLQLIRATVQDEA